MADEIVGQEYPAKGTTYVIPKLENVADAVVAFEEYSDSIPFSEYIQTRTIADSGRAVEPVTKEDNGKMIVAVVDTTLQFGDLPEGFSVACVADAGATITYQGVDKNGQQSTQYQVATVVTVGGLNILSLASPYDGSIGGDNIALGTPPAPVITNPEGASVIRFTEGVPNENQGDATFYSAKIRRADGEPDENAKVRVEQDDFEVVISHTTRYVQYVVDVFGINDEGKGEVASTNAFELNFNDATGGDVEEGVEFTVTQDLFDNQTGDYFEEVGERWRYHQFTTVGDSTLNVTENPLPFRVLVIGGGGSGGTGGGGGGGAGGLINLPSATLSIKEHPVLVGAGATYHNSGSDSALDALRAFGGGKGGNYSREPGSDGGCGGGGGITHENEGCGGDGGIGSQGSNGGQGRNSYGPAGCYGPAGSGGGVANNGSWQGIYTDITGVRLAIGGGGGGGDRGVGGVPNVSEFGGGQGKYGGNGTKPGAGGGGRDSSGAGSGFRGEVVVAYKIGDSTTRQIKQAEAESSARQAGVEQGIQQGYSQAQEDLQEELTSLRTQLSSVGTTDV